MESYQIPRSDRDTITVMTSRTSMVTDMASGVISTPTKCSKPSSEVPGVVDLAACMAHLSVLEEDLGVALFSNLVKDLIIAIGLQKSTTYYNEIEKNVPRFRSQQPYAKPVIC